LAKRFTDTEKWRKPFIRNLPGSYKLLWFYILDNCDHAGIWEKDFEIAQICLGKDMAVCEEDAIRLFGDRVRVLEGKNKWFVPSFIDFQYGALNSQNRVHKSAIKILEKYSLLDGPSMDHTSPMDGAKDKNMDKRKNKDGEKNNENKVFGRTAKCTPRGVHEKPGLVSF